MRLLIRIIIFIALLFLCEFYFTKKSLKTLRAVYPNVPADKLNLFRNIALIFFNLYPLFVVFIWTYQSLFHPANFYFPEGVVLDYFLIYPFWFFIILVVQTILLFAIIDLIKLLLYPLYKKYKSRIRVYEFRFLFLILSFFTVYVPLRMYYDYHTVHIRRTEYKKPDLPGILNNLNLVFISDIHADRYTDSQRLLKFVRKVNATKPDLVLIGGDFISSTPEYIDTAARYIGMIQSKYGIYSCVGDHDNWAYRNDNARSRREIAAALAKYNISMVDDGQRTIFVDTAKIGVTFATETYSKRVTAAGLDTLVKRANNHKYNLKILLVHQPRQIVIDQAKENNYDLLLAGHTHGGQITFLFPFMNLTPTMIETTRLRGDFHIGKMMMVVTRGLGMSIAPVRYNSTPEITRINIHK